jgi:DNA-binding NtrC family response regulator
MFVTPPFKNCLFIDDQSIDNHFATLIVNAMNFAENFFVLKYPKEALKLLKDGIIEPDLIFVDSKVGDMNGSDFVKEYKQIGIDPARTKIYMLEPADAPTAIRATNDDFIAGFVQKHLTPEKLMKIAC